VKKKIKILGQEISPKGKIFSWELGCVPCVLFHNAHKKYIENGFDPN